MGYTHWSRDAYAHLKRSYATKSKAAIFHKTASRTIAPEMDPAGLVFRESRDSANHPNSLAVALFLDVTGSMGRIPEQLIRHKLGALMDTMIDHKVTDPQIMFSAIGDHISDRAPLQVGQFESGTDELNAGLSNIFINTLCLISSACHTRHKVRHRNSFPKKIHLLIKRSMITKKWFVIESKVFSMDLRVLSEIYMIIFSLSFWIHFLFLSK